MNFISQKCLPKRIQKRQSIVQKVQHDIKLFCHKLEEYFFQLKYDYV